MTKVEARRIVRILRQGTVNLESARAISVGTRTVETHLESVLTRFESQGSDGTVILIEDDWGSGKSHVAMLCRGILSSMRVAWINDSVDGRGNSLSHLNRRVPTWLSQIRIGSAMGLKEAVEVGQLEHPKVLAWALRNNTDFGIGLLLALNGSENGWLRTLGYLCAMPDDSRQKEKALEIVINAARLIRATWGGGLVLILDEVENICREWDVRGRKRAYDTLGRLAQCSEVKLILLVTRRFIDQALADYVRAHQETTWTESSRRFLAIATTSDRLNTPKMTNDDAHALIEKIHTIYAISISRTLPREQYQLNDIHTAWARTATKSTRLLVRLTINKLDLLDQVLSFDGRRRQWSEEERLRPLSTV